MHALWAVVEGRAQVGGRVESLTENHTHQAYAPYDSSEVELDYGDMKGLRGGMFETTWSVGVRKMFKHSTSNRIAKDEQKWPS